MQKRKNWEFSLPNRTIIIWASKSGGFHENWEGWQPWTWLISRDKLTWSSWKLYHRCIFRVWTRKSWLIFGSHLDTSLDKDWRYGPDLPWRRSVLFKCYCSARLHCLQQIWLHSPKVSKHTGKVVGERSELPVSYVKYQVPDHLLTDTDEMFWPTNTDKMLWPTQTKCSDRLRRNSPTNQYRRNTDTDEMLTRCSDQHRRDAPT